MTNILINLKKNQKKKPTKVTSIFSKTKKEKKIKIKSETFPHLKLFDSIVGTVRHNTKQTA